MKASFVSGIPKYKKFVTFSKPFSYLDFVLFSQYLLPDQLSY